MSDNSTNSDWISILVVIVAGLISLLKAKNSKKNGPVPVPAYPSPKYGESEENKEVEEEIYDYHPYEEKIENSFLDRLFPGETEDILSSESYRPLSEQSVESYISSEETQEILYEFDIKQAVIGYEIIRRPNY